MNIVPTIRNRNVVRVFTFWTYATHQSAYIFPDFRVHVEKERPDYWKRLLLNTGSCHSIQNLCIAGSYCRRCTEKFVKAHIRKFYKERSQRY